MGMHEDGSPSTLAADVLARSRQPLYLQLAAAFRHQIESGAWAVGQRIPSLETLMAQFQVSRMTVRSALGELEAEGLLSRSRGKGTFIERGLPKVTELELPTTWREAVALSDLLATQEIMAPDSDTSALPELGLACTGRPAPAYRFLCRLHSKDGVPYCYSEVYVAAALFKAHEAQFKALPAASVIARIPGLVLSESRQKLAIIGAGLRSASALQLEVGQAVAEVRRQACVDGELIYFARLEFPTRFVKLELDLLARS